jgi:hypothetical protein
MLYTLPKCNITAVKKLLQQPNPNDPQTKFNVQVQVDGQGLLENASVQFMNVNSGALSPPTTVSPLKDSTFRCARIVVDATLEKGVYSPLITNRYGEPVIKDTDKTFEVG